MNTYEYTAKSSDGELQKGKVTAESQAAFYEELKRRGLFCLRFTETEVHTRQKRMQRMTTKDMVIFCRKFGTMLNSGLSITAALEVLYSSAEKPYLKTIFLDLYEKIQTGMALSAAMQSQTGVFSSFALSMIEAGEESGSIDAILINLAHHYEKENKLHASIRMAITYPVILVSISVVVIILLFTFVLPSLFKVFEGYELPPLTQFMMNLSNFFINDWWLLLLIAMALTVFFAYSSKIPGVNYAFDYLKLKMPIFGKFNQMVYTARLSRSIALLFGSGISLLTTISISCNVLGNRYVNQKFSAVADAVLAGRALSESLTGTKLFEPMFLSMIRVGEESGNIDQVLEHTAEYYDTESDVAVQRMISLLEPALLLVLGVIIALVLVSVMVPMYSMMSTIH